jgi:hypothetical protein
MRIDGSLFYVENVPMGTCWMPAAVAVVALRGDYHYGTRWDRVVAERLRRL